MELHGRRQCMPRSRDRGVAGPGMVCQPIHATGFAESGPRSTNLQAFTPQTDGDQGQAGLKSSQTWQSLALSRGGAGKRNLKRLVFGRIQEYTARPQGSMAIGLGFLLL